MGSAGPVLAAKVAGHLQSQVSRGCYWAKALLAFHNQWRHTAITLMPAKLAVPGLILGMPPPWFPALSALNRLLYGGQTATWSAGGGIRTVLVQLATSNVGVSNIS